MEQSTIIPTEQIPVTPEHGSLIVKHGISIARTYQDVTRGRWLQMGHYIKIAPHKKKRVREVETTLENHYGVINFRCFLHQHFSDLSPFFPLLKKTQFYGKAYNCSFEFEKGVQHHITIVDIMDVKASHFQGKAPKLANRVVANGKDAAEFVESARKTREEGMQAFASVSILPPMSGGQLVERHLFIGRVLPYVCYVELSNSLCLGETSWIIPDKTIDVMLVGEDLTYPIVSEKPF